MDFDELKAILPMSKNVEALRRPLYIGGHTAANRMAVQPMEGCDGRADGAPDELTERRYRNFAQSGAAVIWFEAVAVQEDGRANPRQLWLRRENVDAFKRLIEEIRSAADPQPVIIMQATHSGRYSRPYGIEAAPLIAYNNPVLEKDNPIPADRIISDDALKGIEESYGISTKLAMEAGFDGIDLKSCHGYLNNELLSAYTRPNAYGGSFENRTRFFRNIAAAARANASAGFIVTSRMNIYDGYAHTYGWGMADDGTPEPDLTEPVKLIKELNFEIMDITMGNPYFNPQVNRPVDIVGVERMYRLTKEIRDSVPGLKIIASAPTYLREFSGYLAAGAVEQDYCHMVGFGRMAFAYTGFARDILEDRFNKKKECITCGKCSELMRAKSVTGCVVRDRVYTEIYREVLGR